MREIYLDNSATTAVCKQATDKILEMLTEKYGNPSSLHSKGLQAEHEVEYARKIIAASLGAQSGEIYFTSGGTEANNTAIIGAANARKRSGKRIVTTAIEHSSVLETMQYLEGCGFEVIYLSPDKNGKIQEQDINNAVNSDTILISIMTVNNEIGSIQPINAAVRAVKLKRAHALIHTDAVQAFGKIELKKIRSMVDMMTISAHKIHGPKGVGALYLKNGTRILPLLHGGEQQKKLRPGTEASPLIAGFGAAVNALPDINTELEKIAEINTYCKQKLSEIDGILINSPDDAIPYIINVSALGIRSETMLHFLAMNDIYISSGSACAKGKKSHVLSALELNAKQIDSALRISFSRYNTNDEIDALAAALNKGLHTLAHTK